MDLTDLSSQLGKYLDMPTELPPVTQWNPELSGDIDMLIKSDGTWLHEGDEIKREKLVRLFSTILKREDEEYFLVTPVEKWRIKVEDQPFTIVLIQSSDNDGQILRMITNTGDEFELGPGHDVMLDDHEAPKVHVRGGMYARLNRNAFYAMAKLAIERNDQFYLKSNGVEYQVG